MTYEAAAKATLSKAGIAVGQDYSTLTVEQLAAIIEEAKEVHDNKYKGKMTEEFVRKRYALLQERAARA